MKTYKTPNLFNHAKDRTYAFSNVKLSKRLRLFSVAEVHGLIYPRPSGENFSFACLPVRANGGLLEKNDFSGGGC